jgi:hypothetical protein
VDRVLRPGGALAVWSYGLIAIDAAVDRHVAHLYREVVGPYWPPERALVDSGYAGIALPYAELPAPDFAMEAEWSLEQLGGYLSSWSAVARYRAAIGADPLPSFLRAVATSWGDPAAVHRIRWPLVVRAAKKPM